MNRVILASKSHARSELLRGAGVVFDPVAAGVDEESVKTRLLARGDSPADIALALAKLKAVKVSRTSPDLVIGADQTLEFDGELYDKVDTLEDARARLLTLRGKAHQLHAAVVVAQGGVSLWGETVCATLVMRDFSEAFLDQYLATEGEAALGSVGCYRLEGPGIQLFSKIQGDYFAILGLPLIGLLELLRQRGIIVP